MGTSHRADAPALALRSLTVEDEQQARRAHAELAEDDFTFLLGGPDELPWPDYVARLERNRLGEDLADGFVPATFLVADVGGVIVGRVSVRHRLNEHLTHVGGHIGYCVRRGFRRRGYATEMLRQSLALAAGHGIEQALLTCDDANTASSQVIERCGGVLEGLVQDGRTGRVCRRYWVPTSVREPVSVPRPPSAAG